MIVPAGTLIDERDVEKIEKAGVQSIRIRSVLTCETKNGVCAKCYGRDLARGTPVNIGEAVGVIAAQSIGEPGTQLTMRTFHIGGTAQVVDQSSLESSFEGTIEIRNRNIVARLGRPADRHGPQHADRHRRRDGTERAANRVTYGSRLLVDDGDKVKRGQRLAEWDPYTRPILTEVDGVVAFEDLVDRISVTEIDRRVDRHHQARGHRLARQPARRRPEAGDRRQGQGRQGHEDGRAAPTPATCSRSTPSCRSSRAPR